MTISQRSEFYGTKLLISFVIRTDDRDGLIALLKGLNLKTMLIAEDEDFTRRLDVWVRSEEDATLVKMTASDDIIHESWNLAGPDTDFEIGAVYTHRIGGPASIDYTASPKRRDGYRLWDRVLPNEDAYNQAIAAGVADDPDKFLAWLKAKVREANHF